MRNYFGGATKKLSTAYLFPSAGVNSDHVVWVYTCSGNLLVAFGSVKQPCEQRV